MEQGNVHLRANTKPGFMLYTLEDLQVATDGFSESCIISQLGEDIVYRGRLSSGCSVAIKRFRHPTLPNAQFMVSLSCFSYRIVDIVQLFIVEIGSFFSVCRRRPELLSCWGLMGNQSYLDAAVRTVNNYLLLGLCQGAPLQSNYPVVCFQFCS